MACILIANVIARKLNHSLTFAEELGASRSFTAPLPAETAVLYNQQNRWAIGAIRKAKNSGGI